MIRGFLALVGLLCCMIGAAHAQRMTGELTAESDGAFSRPHDLVLSPDETYLYVADLGNDAIKVLDPATLKTVGAFGEDELSSPHDVAFDAAGRLLVADTGNHRIAIYQVDGTGGALVDMLREGLRTPEGVAVGPDSAVYVTSASRDTVLKYRNGVLVGEVGQGGSGANEYVRPHDIVVTADGRVVVTDPGNNRLQVLTQDLTYVSEIGGPAYAFNEPKYFTSDGRGRLYIADEYNNRIVMLDREYRRFGGIATGGRNEGPRILHHPEGAEISGDRLWISDTGNGRILLYRLSTR